MQRIAVFGYETLSYFPEYILRRTNVYFNNKRGARDLFPFHLTHSGAHLIIQITRDVVSLGISLFFISNGRSHFSRRISQEGHLKN